MANEKTPPQSPLVKLEHEVLELWQREKLFERSVSERSADKPFVFYDGPPYATGLPHIGHLLASTKKDVIPRYKTMRGHRVERRFGWDCHGLPIEVLVEKKLKLNSKKDIETFGIGKFNETCRSIVLEYVDEWKKTITRLGRWVDFDNDYKTMDLDYMESALWAFKQLHDKGLVYEDYRSSLYCTRCETPLSKMETAMDDNYHDVDDPSVYVAFKATDTPNLYFLAWTTTPWTLSANTALAVDKNAEYLEIEIIKGDDPWVGRHMILAKERLPEIMPPGSYKIVATPMGSNLVGRRYERLHDFVSLFDAAKVLRKSDSESYRHDPDSDVITKENPDKAWKIYHTDFVSMDDGTGIVHIAPAFGEDDFGVHKSEGVPVLMTIGDDGRYLPEVTPYAGQHIKAADTKIIEDLTREGKLFKAEKVTHSYPFCWRCKEPLIYKVQQSVYVAVEKIKTCMVETNQEIHWVPSHLKDGRFGQGVEGAPDWGVSRSRYWGIPVPMWKCDGCDTQTVVGSLDEIEKLSGTRPTDLHRPMIDEVTWACQCGGTMQRVPEVFDVWFDSGSMPYGQVHYPFENKEKFEATFPADFITEYIPQTRGWFYYLHVLSNALFDSPKPAFKHCVATGTILADDGTKMSKSKGNMPDSNALLDIYGSDALRLWLLQSATIRGEEANYSEEQIADGLKKVLLPLWNVYSFFSLYAPKDGSLSVAENPTNVLDRWVLARLEETRRDVEQGLEDYELWKAVRPLASFINDLSTWYVRRSRDRFKGDGEADKSAALSTLFTVLVETTKIFAPFTPFIAEAMYQRLRPLMENGLDSVHLESWPAAREDRIDDALLKETATARDVIEAGHALRAQEKLKVRQPLGQMWVSGATVPEAMHEVILEELNVKALATGDLLSGTVSLSSERGVTVAFDTELTPELKREGLRREFVRQVNMLRKKQGLSIEDEVAIVYQTDSAAIEEMLAAERDAVLKDTISRDIKAGEGSEKLKVNGEIITVTLDR